jgi:hypothetical protein
MIREASHTPRRGGFALIVAISLMVFVLMLTLSLSSFTMVETSTSVQHKALEQARLNAKFGLMKAMGQLQEMAGPDQRVTAQASILDNDPATTDIDGIARAKYWTGVWNSEYPTSGGTPISVHQIANNPYNVLANRRADSDAADSRFLGWLVSGDLDLTDAQNYTPNDTDDALLLSNSDNDETVYARKVAISDTDDTSLGRYAYWIDDEGVKAKFNILDIHKEEALNNDERRYSVMTAQRSGVENMTQLAQAGFPVNDSILNNMASSASLSSYYSSRGASDATLSALAQDTFHDLTAYSYGLLTDPKHGGFKKDLTWYFEQTSGNDIPDSLEAVSFYVNPAFTGFSNGEPRVADFPDPYNIYSEPGPTWKKLRSWYQLKDTYSANDAVVPRPTTETQQGVGPKLLRFILGVSPEVLPDSNDPNADVYVRVHLDAKVVLWNPYNVRLAPHTYEVEFYMGGNASVLYPQFLYDENITGKDADKAVTEHVTTKGLDHYRCYYPNSYGIEHGGPANKNGGLNTAIRGVFQHPDMTTSLTELGGEQIGSGVVFSIEDVSFEPGEVKVFTINNLNDNPYKEGYKLSEGYHPGTVYLPYTVKLPDAIAKGVEVEVTLETPDPLTGATTKKEIRYPAFHWRPWRSWGAPDLSGLGFASNQDYSVDMPTGHPYGEIWGAGLREPLDSGPYTTRDIRTGGSVQGLDAYYTRQFRENLGRAEVNENTRDESVFVTRTSTPIFLTRDEGPTARLLGSDWDGMPNFKAKIEYSAYMYPFEEGSPYTGTANPIAAAMIHWNPVAVESRRLGYTGTGENAIPGLSGYNAIGWTSAVRYLQYGKTETAIDRSGSQAYFGRSFSQSTGMTSIPFMDVPREDQPILSLGFFQNANFNRQESSPTYQIGNSYPEIRLVSATDLYREKDSQYNEISVGQAGVGAPTVIDSTYLLNDALWDRFFLSTYVDPDQINNPDFTPPNARMTRIDPQEQVPDDAIDDFFDMAAAYLAVNGAFNVNSTSVEAWKAALGSLSGLDINLSSGGTSGTTLDRVVTHFMAPAGGSNDSNESNLWQGFRQLDATQLNALAEKMVEQVKKRGPFFSLGEFVNRRLADETDETSRRGALQAAIEALDYNGNSMSTASGNLNATAGNVLDPGKFTGDTEMNPAMYLEQAARTHRYAGVPGWVKQGDIIQAIGPSLTVRSDTFRIRAYGETINPITNERIASAVCEAIVQRVPTPVTPVGNTPGTLQYYEPDDALGRKFEIVSFNWLTPEEI